MNSFFYTYNNEALVSLVIIRLLKEVKNIELARIAAIIPILLNDQSIETLNSGNCKTLKQFFREMPGNQLKYNSYYYAMLPILINSLKIVVNSGFASFNKGKFYLIENNISAINSDNIGTRYCEICATIPLFLSLVNKYPTEKIYELFKIRL